MAEDSRLRSKQIRVHLSENELKIAKEKAAYCGLNMSEYIRKIINDGVIIKYDINGLRDLCNEINKIGVNINQIAKQVNSTKSIYGNDIANLQLQFDNLFDMVINKLLGIQ